MNKKITCKICRNTINNSIYEIKERQLNQGQIFQYLHCHKCGTLQLIDNLDDIGKYYLKNYPAFRTRESVPFSLITKIVRKCVSFFLVRVQLPQKLHQIILMSDYEHMNCLVGTHIGRKSKILDVGCGAGNWLRNIRDEGYIDLTGIDLFTGKPKDLVGWRFLQGDIFSDRLQKYDCITLHHSFEHMPNPLNVLKRIEKLLNENGLCIIRIPIMKSLAWDIYQEDWYQIDAPRHLYLYTTKALQYLCKKAGLKITRIVYDSEPLQFYVSEMYQKTDYDLRTIMKRLDKKRDTNVRMTAEVNCNKKGDQAIFYIKKCHNK